jgi:hypothetical protein
MEIEPTGKVKESFLNINDITSVQVTNYTASKKHASFQDNQIKSTRLPNMQQIQSPYDGTLHKHIQKLSHKSRTSFT